MKSKEYLQSQIKEINLQISKTKKQLDALNSKKFRLENELGRIIQFETTSSFLQDIHTLSQNNMMSIRLYNDTRTTPIMDTFYNSNNAFLVLEKVFSIYPNWKYISLVVSKGRQGVNYKYNGLTMTDLKKAAGTYVSEHTLTYHSKDSRLYPLYEELIEIGKKHLIPGERIPFKIPCLLGGQTFNDQTGFGSEYCGEDLIYQGKEYGETTKFFIIGVIVEK